MFKIKCILKAFENINVQWSSVFNNLIKFHPCKYLEETTNRTRRISTKKSTPISFIYNCTCLNNVNDILFFASKAQYFTLNGYTKHYSTSSKKSKNKVKPLDKNVITEPKEATKEVLKLNFKNNQSESFWKKWQKKFREKYMKKNSKCGACNYVRVKMENVEKLSDNKIQFSKSLFGLGKKDTESKDVAETTGKTEVSEKDEKKTDRKKGEKPKEKDGQLIINGAIYEHYNMQKIDLPSEEEIQLAKYKGSHKTSKLRNKEIHSKDKNKEENKVLELLEKCKLPKKQIKINKDEGEKRKPKKTDSMEENEEHEEKSKNDDKCLEWLEKNKRFQKQQKDRKEKDKQLDTDECLAEDEVEQTRKRDSIKWSEKQKMSQEKVRRKRESGEIKGEKIKKEKELTCDGIKEIHKKLQQSTGGSKLKKEKELICNGIKEKHEKLQQTISRSNLKKEKELTCNEITERHKKVPQTISGPNPGSREKCFSKNGEEETQKSEREMKDDKSKKGEEELECDGIKERYKKLQQSISSFNLGNTEIKDKNIQKKGEEITCDGIKERHKKAQQSISSFSTGSGEKKKELKENEIMEKYKLIQNIVKAESGNALEKYRKIESIIKGKKSDEEGKEMMESQNILMKYRMIESIISDTHSDQKCKTESVKHAKGIKQSHTGFQKKSKNLTKGSAKVCYPKKGKIKENKRKSNQAKPCTLKVPLASKRINYTKHDTLKKHVKKKKLENIQKCPEKDKEFFVQSLAGGDDNKPEKECKLDPGKLLKVKDLSQKIK